MFARLHDLGREWVARLQLAVEDVAVVLGDARLLAQRLAAQRVLLVGAEAHDLEVERLRH